MASEFDKIMARADRERRRRERREERQAERKRGVLRIVIIVLAALMLVALVADLRRLEGDVQTVRKKGSLPRQGDAASLAAALDAYGPGSPRTEVPTGRASWMTPPGWRALRPDPETSFETVLRGPYGIEMAVETYVTNRPTFNGLVDKIRQLEASWAGNFHIDVRLLGKNRAVKRSVQLYKNRILIYDFTTGDIGHHIQFAIPTALYDEYEDVLTRLVAETYEEGRIIASLPEAAE